MTTFTSIDKCFDFLQSNAGSEITFNDLMRYTSWTEENLKTNISKRIWEFLVAKNPRSTPISARKYYVNRNILNVDKDKFRDLFRQKNQVFSYYKLNEFFEVKIFDFFLPLTNENLLHQNLDELFFKDTLNRRLRAIELDELLPIFPRNTGEDLEEYFSKLTDLASDLFWGYSISHVSGRYRTRAEILTRREAADLQGKGYLVDETTAIVKFIFPHEEGKSEHYDKLDKLFKILFVKAITESTPDEDEVWLLESFENTTLNKYTRISH